MEARNLSFILFSPVVFYTQTRLVLQFFFLKKMCRNGYTFKMDLMMSEIILSILENPPTTGTSFQTALENPAYRIPTELYHEVQYYPSYK
jgi:hypothetical protein